MAAIKDDNNRVREWENGLPSTSDLTPLSHSLISGVLARAFCIPPSSAPANTAEEVMRASQSTLQLLQQKKPPAFSLPLFDPYSSYEAGGGRGPFGLDEGMDEDRHGHDSLKRGSDDTPQRGVRGAVKGPPMFGSKEGWGDGENGPERDGVGTSSRIGGFGNGNPTPEMGHGYFWPPQGVVPAGQGLFAPLGSDHARYGGLVEAGSESMKGASLDKSRKVGDTESEDVDSADGPDGNTARTLKRPRLVWTPQLHKRFVDAVGHLGIKNAVPKTIMQLMNVEGLTRENVASHLQKYRLYLKRMHGLSTEGPSASDPLFASTPLPPGLGASHFFSSHQHSRPESGVSGTPFSSPPVPVPRGQGSLPPPGGMEAAAAAAAAAAAVRAAPAMGLGPVHFRGFENHPYNIALPRTASSQRPGGLGEHRDLLVNNNNSNHSSQPGGAGSPPHRVLPLFPPSGR